MDAQNCCLMDESTEKFIFLGRSSFDFEVFLWSAHVWK